MKERHPEVSEISGHFKFRGQGQKRTDVADMRGAVELTFLLPGRHAARVPRQAAELLCRYLGGDLALVDEVCVIRGFQEELAVRAPEDPRRVFGVVVEATTIRASGSQLAQILAAMNERMTNQEKILATIRERFEQDRQRPRTE